MYHFDSGNVIAQDDDGDLGGGKLTNIVKSKKKQHKLTPQNSLIVYINFCFR